jgi:SAM-dependent methyltransferase
VTAPEPPGAGDPAFYVPIGRFQGASYARNAFTKGTEEEVGALRDLLDLRPGDRLLDVGCGDGRHARRLAGQGVHVTGVDVSAELIAAGRAAAGDEGVEVTWHCGDARELRSVLGDRSAGFDVVWSLCQGALGTSATVDPLVAAELAAVVRPGGRVVVTLFHALFAARHLAPGDAFDPVHLPHHRVSGVRGPDHARASFDLWTAAYTVREGAALLEDVGLEVVDVRGVEPGAYGRRAPGEVALDDPELLFVAARP